MILDLEKKSAMLIVLTKLVNHDRCVAYCVFCGGRARKCV